MLNFFSKISNAILTKFWKKHHFQISALANISKDTGVHFEQPYLLENGVMIYPVKEFNFSEIYRSHGHKTLRSDNNIQQVIIHYTECDIKETINIFTMDQYVIRLLIKDEDVAKYLVPLNKGKEILIVNHPELEQIKVFYREIKVKNFGSKNQFGGNFFLLNYNEHIIEKDPSSPTVLNSINGLIFNNETILDEAYNSSFYNFIGDQVKGIGITKLSCAGFAGSSISSHYVITENEPSSHIPGGIIIQIIKDHYVTSHAGRSTWKGNEDLNLTSISIELINPGHNGKGWEEEHYYSPNVTWNKFDQQQIDSLIALSTYLKQRYNISPENFLGHEDIAPSRKQDPGPFFPWKRLYEESGVGAWLTTEELYVYRQEFFNEHPEYGNDLYRILNFQDQNLFFIELNRYGYSIDDHKQALRAFKSHFSCNNNFEQFTKTKEATVNDWVWIIGLVSKYL